MSRTSSLSGHPYPRNIFHDRMISNESFPLVLVPHLHIFLRWTNIYSCGSDSGSQPGYAQARGKARAKVAEWRCRTADLAVLFASPKPTVLCHSADHFDLGDAKAPIWVSAPKAQNHVSTLNMIELVAMGAAGRLGVLWSFWCFFFLRFFLFLFDDGVGWGGVGC